MDGIIDVMDMSLCRLWELVTEEDLACCNKWDRKGSDMIEELN